MATAKVGQPAPDFDMPSTRNIEKLDQNVKLSDYSGKWVVLLFYPLDFTFVCPTELTSFSDRYDDFEGIGAAVIGGRSAAASGRAVGPSGDDEPCGRGNVRHPGLPPPPGQLTG